MIPGLDKKLPKPPDWHPKFRTDKIGNFLDAQVWAMCGGDVDLWEKKRLELDAAIISDLCEIAGVNRKQRRRVKAIRPVCRRRS